MMALSRRMRVAAGVCGWLALVASASCTGAPEIAPLEQAPRAHVEPLLPNGALLNAVSLTEGGAGAAVGELGAILVTGDAGATWTAVESPTPQSLRGVAFADATTAVAAGAGGTVLRTEDAGRSWRAVSSGAGAELRAVAFGSPTMALIVGENGAVLRSDDAGRSWRAASSGTTATLRAVAFASASVAVAVGDDGVVVQSADGGATWRVRESATSAALRGVCFSDATTGVAVGGDDRRWRAARIVLHTKDGGASWTQSSVPSGARLYGAANTGPGKFISAGESGQAIRTTDSGETWSAAGTAIAGAAAPGAYNARSDTTNWLAGIAASGSAIVGVTYGGRIYRSTDAAATWTQVPKESVTADLAAVALAGPDTFVVAGGEFILRSAGGAPLERVHSARAAGGGGRGGAGEGAAAGVGAAAGGGGAGGKGPGLRVLSLHFPSPLLGLAVGVGGAIQRSVDGGTTWTAVESTTKRNLRGVGFADDKVGIAVAGPAGTGAGMIRTEDGGRTWREQPCVPGTAICTSSDPLFAVALLPSQFGMAVGGGRGGLGPAIAIRTTDGGRSWTKLNLGFVPGQLQALALLDERTALAVGNLGAILHTRDGGATWTRRNSGAALNLAGVAFGDALRGLIVGQAGTVLATADGGATWRREPPVTTRDLTAVRFEDADTAIITGAAGVVLRHTWTAADRPPAGGAGRGGSHE